MNKIPCFLVVLSLAVTQAGAAVESVGLAKDNVLPFLPSSLQMQAFTRGSVELAVDVSAEGKPTDCLVLSYTHEPLVAACVNAVQTWRFIPAKVDGVAVPAHIEFTIDFTVDGIVVNSVRLDQMFVRTLCREDEHLTRRVRSAAELDHPPARVAGPAPKYATAALRQGVQGRVQVRFFVDQTGSVRMPSVDSSAQPYLAETALAAVRGWKFEPPVSKGQPVLISASEEFIFGQAN
jgi:TonB family protein